MKCLMKGFLKSLHVIPSQKTTFAILNDVSGIVKPGRMTLLLGPPSSGKTTLLKALAGETDKDLKVSGKITYNGHEMHEFVPQRTSTYTSQHDLHIGELTVRETLAFSARCQGVGARHAYGRQVDSFCVLLFRNENIFSVFFERHQRFDFDTSRQE